MNSLKIRKAFLDFFKNENHPIIESSSLIPEGDPSLLFTSAGMVQFKPYYLGLKSDLKRATSCQKCFRTTDIDNVGKTIRHLTFFEMLGNFSFGDYFKEESLKWGYDFLVKEMGIEPYKLFFSVYRGGIAPKDEEAYNIWKKILPPQLHSHIFEMGEDNFWSMGETGPSGPCSEIYYDRGEEFSHNGCLGPACSCDRYIEVWNHVFTQFDKQKDGTFNPLPQKNIDTGMGLERLVFIIEKKFSPFESSLFYPIIEKFINLNLDKMTEPKSYFEAILKYFSSPELFRKNVIESNAYTIIPNLRIISDHLRAAAFLISAGILPSNEGRGYVLRRLIRRAERFGMTLGVKDAFLYKLIDPLIDIFGKVYPELDRNKTHIESILKFEEEGFIETLEKGEKYLNDLIEKTNKRINGQEAFKLYETYGFPLELTREIAAKRNIKIDEKEFEKAKEQAQLLSRLAWKSSGEKNSFFFQKAEEKLPPTNFTGYEKTEDRSKLIAMLDENGNLIEEIPQGEVYLIFEKTPFYAESGGQMADTGTILFNGKEIAQITDVQKPLGKVFYHKATVNSPIKTGIEFELRIDTFKRIKTAANHTATHLINAALKMVFGKNTTQAGSMVNYEKFRFDYTIPRTPLPEELSEVEKIANNAIITGNKIFKEIRPLSDAAKLGATILVGEKYSDPARFILINKEGFKNANEKYSLELCGGTHVDDLKEVFFVKIIKDSSVSRGIRRIEGIAGYAAVEYLITIANMADKTAMILNINVNELAERVYKVKEELKEAKTEIQKLKKDKLVTGTVRETKIKEDINFIFHEEKENDIKILRETSDKYKNEKKKAILFIFSQSNKKINFIFSISNDLKNSNFDAAFLAKKAAEKFNGKAGGRKDFAQGGGNIENSKDLYGEILNLLKENI